jgi:adenylylsulfate reductase subunit A
MRCWENIHRTWQADAHLQTLYFREETRWPGYYYRADFKEMDEDNWKCFVNCVYDNEKDAWEMKKVPIKNFVK